MYTEEMAKELKEDAGKKWRPSNGTEGMIFEEMYCDHCVKAEDDNPCGIIGLSMCFDVDDLKYPPEWQIGTDGQPICTAFKEEKNEM